MFLMFLKLLEWSNNMIMYLFIIGNVNLANQESQRMNRNKDRQ